MAGVIGNVHAFDNSEEKWDTYFKILEQYCLANHIAK